MKFCPKPAEKKAGLNLILAASIVAAALAYAAPAMSQDVAPLSNNPAAHEAAAVNPAPGENNQGGYADPLSPFNEAMFTFNLKLDDWVLRPVASGYATIAPEEVRVSVGNFLDNTRFIPRFANNLFQFLNLIALLADEQLGVPDNVDEQDVADFELHV